MLGVAVALAILAAVLVALLAVPASLSVHVERAAAFRTTCRIIWLFGWVDVSLGRRKPARPRRSHSPAEGARSSRDTSKPPRRSRARRGPATALALVRTRGFLRRMLRLLTDLGRGARCEDLYLRAEFGLDDPADTGQLYGAVAPLLIAATAGGFDVSCRPNFFQPGLQGSCGGRIRVRPISLVGLLVGFLCSLPTLRAIRAVWVSRR